MPASPNCWAAPTCLKTTIRSVPRALCEALLDGMSSMQMEQDIRIVLLNQFDLVLTTELAQIYQSINRYLVDRGILPDLKVGAKSRATTQRPLLHRGSAAPCHAGQAATCSSCSSNWRRRQPAAGRRAAAQASAGFSLLDSLGQLQSGAMMLPGGGRFELPLLEAAAIQNVLRSLQQSPVMQAASPLDAVLVDAVAMLFDVVFDEAAIPDRLKAQIARLQIPVLKAAMLDRNFFSQSNHPVRRMLDAIATLAVHLPENEAGNARLEAISQVVSRVLDSFEKDIAVFDSAAAELEAMGALLEDTLEETVDASLQQDIAQIKQAERAELAPVIVHDFINRALKDQPVAEAVREFLRRDWAQLLTLDYINEGEAGRAFQQPRRNHARTGMERAAQGRHGRAADAGAHSARIAETPARRRGRNRFAAKAGRPLLCHPGHPARQRGASQYPAGTAARHHARKKSRKCWRSPTHAATAAEADAGDLTPNPPCPKFEDEFTLRARALNKGDWVEFHYDDGTFRWARLGWVSGVKNTYLFSDQDGMNSFSISLHRLADKLRRGEAVLVERKSITESAFGKLMNLFRQKLGHA